MFGHIGAELGDQRQRGGLAAGGDHLAEQPRVGAELSAAFLDVRAGDVELEGADTAQRVKAARDLGVFLDRGAPDVDDRRARAGSSERASIGSMKPSTPGPCRPIALSRPLVTSAVRGVGLPLHRVEADALDHDRAELVEVDQAGVFDAVAEGAGGHRDRVGQPSSCRFERTGPVLLGSLPGSLQFLPSHLRESNTGPSVQVRWYSQPLAGSRSG